ncbi:MAG: Uma2 family endonuclease [Archangium sp.]|nr:Uma2 family endonuclease [Archangium sp.]MDP3152182.1 Uma2 family endonuclease [Archangium sp.]MDP3574936.1 Uma2 family endonuclease [Archangium sp.]
MQLASHQPEDSDQRVFLRVGWRGLKNLLASRGNTPVPRISYLDGVMELMSPGKTHESRSWLIGRLLEVWADEHEVLLEGLKSWTLKNEGKEAGAEPDECWVVGDRPTATKPDLALEVVQTRGGLDKLEIYRRLGVKEVWFWIDGEITVHVLRGRSYVRSAKSTLFKSLDLKQLTQFVRHPAPARARMLYRAALRRG